MNGDNPLIPIKYTCIADVTSLYILQHSLICYYYDEYLLFVLLWLCYIMTNMHWNYIRSDGIIRTLDICIVNIILFISIYKALQYDCYLRYYIGTCISVGGFACNEYLNHLTLYRKDFPQMQETYKNQVYWRSCLVHTSFLHIFQMLNGCTVLVYCLKR